MPLEIKRHTVPHLKALTRSIEGRSGLGRGSTFKHCHTVMKSTILLHKWPKRGFHVMATVGGQMLSHKCELFWVKSRGLLEFSQTCLFVLFSEFLA